MNWVAALVVRYTITSWIALALLAITSGYLAGNVTRDLREQERQSLLELDAVRSGIEIMSQTLNASLMGAVGMLGILDTDIKREALGKLAANNSVVLDKLESIGRSYDTQGVFIVTESGIIASSWDSAGKPSTGLNVKFRPYYQMAMQGMENIYAAVSLARGDRALYFSAPIYSGTTNAGDATGAIVARTSVHRIDNLLRDKGDIALLLSPQGVVFASSRTEWIGHLAGVPTPERIKAIRDLKQFGNMFENREPPRLPVTVERGQHSFDGKRYAVATANVQWNDPFGDWKLVMLEDLGRTVPLAERLRVALAVGLLALLLGGMVNRVLRGHYAQMMATAQLAELSRAQQASAERKTQLASAALNLQNSRSHDDLIRVYLDEGHKLLGVLQGVVYLFDAGSQTTLRLAGSYACAELPPPTLTVGEGLLGQCAVERCTQIIETSPDGFGAIRSGLGEAHPATLMLAPILLNAQLLGVVEVALLTHISEAERTQFEEMTALLAMNLEIIGRSAQTEEMLSSTQAAQQAATAQLTFQQVLVDTIPYPVFTKGADTRFISCNRAYEETFNLAREQLIGKRVLDLDYLPEADRIIYQAEDEATIATVGTVRRDMRIPFSDGKLHDTIYYVSGFRGMDGAPGGLVGTFIDVSAIKNAEREMERLSDAEQFNRLAQGREQRIIELKHEVNQLAAMLGQASKYASAELPDARDFTAADGGEATASAVGEVIKLADLVDLKELQVLFSAFCESVGIAAAIIDLDGEVLASSSWQRACTDFHRVNPESCKRCIESDTELSLKLQDGQDYTMYQCKNGMTDCASPIIVEGRHLANMFIGQFHLAAPDLAFFRAQAQQFGYPEADYLAAVSAAPVVDKQRLPTILGFLTGFARMVTTTSLARRRADAAQQHVKQQAEQLQRERIAAMSLAEDAEQARQALESASSASVAKESDA